MSIQRLTTPTQTPITTIVDVLRHGQPVSDGCLNGHHDAELTEQGWQQLRHTLRDPIDYNRVISSPLQRCRKFAVEFAEQCSLSIQIVEDWQEMFFGEWDGMSYTSLHEHYPQQLSDFWRNPWQCPPPGGETMPEFCQRVISAWQQLLKDHAGEKILVVSHSGVIRQLLAFILGMEPKQSLAMSRFNIPYASLTRIEIYHDEHGGQWPRLMFVNGLIAV